MAFKFSAPNPGRALPTPRVYVPDSGMSNAGGAALLGGLGAAQQMSELYSDHKESQDQAETIAKLFDANGMPEQGQAYRDAAKSYRLNFFKSPASANAGRNRMLNDLLSVNKLIQDKKQTEALQALREEERKTRNEYQRDSLAIRKGDSERRASEAKLKAAMDQNDSKGMIEAGLAMGIINEEVAGSLKNMTPDGIGKFFGTLQRKEANEIKRRQVELAEFKADVYDSYIQFRKGIDERKLQLEVDRFNKQNGVRSSLEKDESGLFRWRFENTTPDKIADILAGKSINDVFPTSPQSGTQETTTPQTQPPLPSGDTTKTSAELLNPGVGSDSDQNSIIKFLRGQGIDVTDDMLEDLDSISYFNE